MDGLEMTLIPGTVSVLALLWLAALDSRTPEGRRLIARVWEFPRVAAGATTLSALALSGLVLSAVSLDAGDRPDAHRLVFATALAVASLLLGLVEVSKKGRWMGASAGAVSLTTFWSYELTTNPALALAAASTVALVGIQLTDRQEGTWKRHDLAAWLGAVSLASSLYLAGLSAIISGPL